jgi:DNA-binding MarR family transcriptional regulator
MSTKRLCVTLGVTGARAQQVASALRKAKLIARTKSARDVPANTFSLTSRGRAQLEGLNAALKKQIVSPLYDRGRPLASVNAEIKALMQLITSGPEHKPGT